MRLVLAFFAITILSSPSYAESKTLVLISHADNPTNNLSPREIRKLFLGAKIKINGKYLIPVINRSSYLLHQVFLQKTIFMSAQRYERQLLSKLFKTGASRPILIENENDLIHNFENNKNYISYMWMSDYKKHKNLKIITQIWQGVVD